MERDSRLQDARRSDQARMREEEEQREFVIYVENEAMALHQSGLGHSCTESWECKAKFVCRDSKCSECKSDDECSDSRAQTTCVIADESPELEHNTCLHKRAFPIGWKDAFQIFMCFFVTVVAAPVGIGGGAILVPIFMYAGGFSAHGAIPLSKATILGGAITNTILNLQRRHPFANRPLVDWISLKLVLPNLLAGSIFGVLLLAALPAWIILIAVCGVMSYNSWKVSTRAVTEVRTFFV